MFVFIFNVLNVVLTSDEKDKEASTSKDVDMKSFKRKFKKSEKEKEQDENPKIPKLEENIKEDEKYFKIEKHKIGDKLSSGGTKQVFKYGDDLVVAFLPLNLIKNEMKVISDLKKLGLQTQNSQIGKLEKDGEEEWALVMESWESMQSKGFQIRDSKNQKTKYGTSMLFQTRKNINLENMLRILRPMMEDCFKLIINGMFFGIDAFNVVIKDTEKTDISDRKEYKVYTERNQICGLFFCDFTFLDEYENWKKINLKTLFDITQKQDSSYKFDLNKNMVGEVVRNVFKYGCDAAVFSAIKENELEMLRKEEPSSLLSLFDSVFYQAIDILMPELIEKCCLYFTKQLEENEEFREKLK